MQDKSILSQESMQSKSIESQESMHQKTLQLEERKQDFYEDISSKQYDLEKKLNRARIDNLISDSYYKSIMASYTEQIKDYEGIIQSAGLPSEVIELKYEYINEQLDKPYKLTREYIFDLYKSQGIILDGGALDAVTKLQHRNAAILLESAGAELKDKDYKNTWWHVIYNNVVGALMSGGVDGFGRTVGKNFGNKAVKPAKKIPIK